MYYYTFFPSFLISTFLILFAAFIQFLSRSCPLPFLQIPSPIHSQKLVHNQEEEEDQPQATPPSGTHMQMYVPRPFVHLLRDGLEMCTTWTYMNVCTDTRRKITFMDSRAVHCCYLSNSLAVFWSNLDIQQLKHWCTHRWHSQAPDIHVYYCCKTYIHAPNKCKFT